MRRSVIFCCAVSAAVTLGAASLPADPSKSLTASVTITTSGDRRSIAVLSTGAPFLFCIDLAAPLPQTLAYSGVARVFFRPLPAIAAPAGITVEGPENVTAALAVLPAEGKGWLFLAEDEPTVLPAGDAGAARVTTVPVTMVRRVDWVAASGGPRRGMDVEGCFAVGG